VVLELALIADAKRGIDYYIDNVVGALAELDSRNRYTLFAYFFKGHAEKAARLPRPNRDNFETRYVRFPERLVRALDHRRGWPVAKALLGGRGPDVYHVLAGGCLPHVAGAKTIVTFFDLSDETIPKSGKPEPGKKISSPYTYELARRADLLIATSENLKKELIRYYALPESKIRVLTSGVDLKRFRPVTDPEALRKVRERYRLPERYLLVVGPYIPLFRTNADFIVRAFALLKDGAAKGCSLVLIGSRGGPLESLLNLAEELGLRERIVTTGYVPIEDLPAIYTLALGCVHPTSVEGFGFGLEVMACGTPFIASTTAGNRESMGDAALSVPPQQVAPLSDAIKRLLEDEPLRRALREKGLSRAALFSYEEIARKLVAIYEELVN